MTHEFKSFYILWKFLVQTYFAINMFTECLNFLLLVHLLLNLFPGFLNFSPAEYNYQQMTLMK